MSSNMYKMAGELLPGVFHVSACFGCQLTVYFSATTERYGYT